MGRILDWHKKNIGVEDLPAVEDPGVVSLTGIFNYYKRFGYPTQVMGASFRRGYTDEKAFRWMMNENAMATEKLAEGIRNFTKDLIKLEKQIERLL